MSHDLAHLQGLMSSLNTSSRDAAADHTSYFTTFRTVTIVAVLLLVIAVVSTLNASITVSF